MTETDFQKRKTERYNAIRQDFAQLQAEGGQAMAMYEVLGKKYGFTAAHIYRIVSNKI